MATTSNEEIYEITDFSGGIQRKSTLFLGKTNQARYASNADFGSTVGGVIKIRGYTHIGNTITTTSSSSTSTTTSTSTSSTSSSTSSTSSTTTP